jgi:hypothetical protein
MGRPKKAAQRLFYDEFYAMTIEQQAIALMILAEHHEYVKQEAAKNQQPARSNGAALVHPKDVSA